MSSICVCQRKKCKKVIDLCELLCHRMRVGACQTSGSDRVVWQRLFKLTYSRAFIFKPAFNAFKRSRTRPVVDYIYLYVCSVFDGRSRTVQCAPEQSGHALHGICTAKESFRFELLSDFRDSFVTPDASGQWRIAPHTYQMPEGVVRNLGLRWYAGERLEPVNALATSVATPSRYCPSHPSVAQPQSY